jgi:hypothetical protein
MAMTADSTSMALAVAMRAVATLTLLLAVVLPTGSNRRSQLPPCNAAMAAAGNAHTNGLGKSIMAVSSNLLTALPSRPLFDVILPRFIWDANPSYDVYKTTSVRLVLPRLGSAR